MQWNERKEHFSYEGFQCMLCTCETRPLRYACDFIYQKNIFSRVTHFTVLDDSESVTLKAPNRMTIGEVAVPTKIRNVSKNRSSRRIAKSLLQLSVNFHGGYN